MRMVLTMKLDIIAFTSRGAALAEKLIILHPDSRATAPDKYCGASLQPLKNLNDWTKSHFQTGGTLVFIGAVGIAVRAVAPYINDKVSDAVVICIDESGENIIPLLCGHIGGANRAAKILAENLGGQAIITTATDINNAFAIDEWAARNKCVITNPPAIKHISAALLDGEEIGIHSDFPVVGDLPPGISECAVYGYGIEIAFNSKAPYPTTLHIIPRIVVAGIGCRKGVSAEVLEDKLYEALAEAGIPVEAVSKLATIDIKTKEPGLLALRDKLKVELIAYPAQELMSAQGEFEKSERVFEATGADNVCQRAVVCAGAKLITGKIAAEGVTIALGAPDWTVDFRKEVQS